MTVRRQVYRYDWLQNLQVLATYRNQLREYRALQEELTPWTEAFTQRHGRKPRLIDVERTGEPLLCRHAPFVC